MWNIEKDLLHGDILIQKLLIITESRDVKKLKLLSIVKQGEYFALFLYLILSNSRVELERVIEITQKMQVSVLDIDSRHFRFDLSDGEQDLSFIIPNSEEAKFFIKKLTDLVTTGESGFCTEYYSISSKKLLIPTTKSTGFKGAPTGQKSENPFILPNLTFLVEDVKKVKDAWIAKKMKSQQSQFCSYSPITIFAGSWNVAGTSPKESLQQWLTNGPDENPDIIVLGFQEVDLSTEAYLRLDPALELAWSQQIESALLSFSDGYSKVSSKQLIGMVIFVYVNVRHVKFVTEVTSESVGSGLLGMMGNKGAVSTRFRIYDSYFTFINSHLAADQNLVERRNQDYSYIAKKLAFSLPAKYKQSLAYLQANPWVPNISDIPNPFNADLPSAERLPSSNSVSMFESDVLIWLGDLNYRINMTEVEVKKLIQSKDFGKMLEKDQLIIEKRSKRTFVGFEEKDITFEPTYKYDIGTDNYDTSEKRRCPAWCDRILWLKNPFFEENLICTAYNSCHSMLSSDHKPVSASFIAQVRKIDMKCHDKILSDIVRELDKLENEATPVLNLEMNNLNYGKVTALNSYSLTFQFRNAGQVIARFLLVSHAKNGNTSKPWFTVTPSSGSIFPGESIEIAVKLFVTAVDVKALNSGAESIEDIIIFHVEQGQDHFISLSAEWVPSCFGESIVTLCALRKPVASCSVNDLTEISTKEPIGENQNESLQEIKLLNQNTELGGKLGVPKELWVLVDYIYRNGLDVDYLFSRYGDPLVNEYIRECINNGVDINNSRLFEDIFDISAISESRKSTIAEYLASQPSNMEASDHLSRGKSVTLFSVCETLQLLLVSFVEPVIPTGIQERCINEGYLTFSAAKQVIRNLPQSHYNVFVYVVAFLSFLCKNYRGRGEDITSATLAKLFAPVLLRGSSKPPMGTTTSEKSIVSVTSYLNPFGYYLNSAKSSQLPPQSDSILDVETLGKRKAMFLQHFLDNSL